MTVLIVSIPHFSYYSLGFPLTQFLRLKTLLDKIHTKFMHWKFVQLAKYVTCISLISGSLKNYELGLANMTEKHFVIKAFHVTINKWLLLCPKYLEYCHTGDMTFPVLSSISSQAVFFFQSMSLFFLSGYEAWYQNLKPAHVFQLLLRQLTQLSEWVDATNLVWLAVKNWSTKAFPLPTSSAYILGNVSRGSEFFFFRTSEFSDIMENCDAFLIEF